MEIEAKERELALLRNSIAAKEREYCDIWQSTEDRSMELMAMDETLKSVQNQIVECERNLRLKEEDCSWKFEMMDKLISEREIAIEMYGVDLGAKETRLCVVEGLIREREQELQAKQIELRNIDKELRVKVKEKEFCEFSVRVADCNEEGELDLMKRLKQFEGRVKEIGLREKQFEGQAKEVESQEKQFIGRAKELASKEKQFEGRVKEIELREKQLQGQAKELESKEKQFEQQLKEFDSKQKKFEGKMKQFEKEQKQFRGQVKAHSSKEKKLEKLESKEKKFEGRVKEIELREKQFEGQVKELESKEKHLEGQLQELESKRKQFEEQLKEFDSKQKHFEGQMKQFETEQKQFRGQVKAHSSKEKKLESKEKQVQELKAKEKQFEVRAKELESKEKEFEGQVKDLESQKNQYAAQMKEIESREAMLNEQLEGHKSKENQLEAQMKDLEYEWNLYEEKLKELELKEKQIEDLGSKRNQFEEKLKELELKEAQFSVQLKELKSKEKQFEDLESKRDQYEAQVKELGLKEMQFRLALKKLESEENQFEGRLKDLQSKQNQFGRQQKELELKEKRCELLRKSFEEGQLLKEKSSILLHQVKAEPQDFSDDDSVSKYNQLTSPTTSDGRNLQFLSNEPELIGNDILDCLQTSADPAALVLDIIQNPIVPQDRNGNEGIIIDESHIMLLDQLMRISPSLRINLDIRDVAKKLATDLKANMNPCDENSLVVLGFLLLLSNYGLVSHFNEDEVFKLLEFAAQHKQAIELFRTLGFGDKITDFVQNLVEKKQYVDAARFICAYKLADKINPIDLLRLEISRAERISKKIKKKSIEQKVRCKELELGILRKVLQCISDNNLGSHQDLVNSVQDRILSLERRKEELIVLAKQKEELCRLVSKLSSALEVHQPEEKKCAYKEFTENQVHRPEDKISADITVTDNQVKVQQPKEKESARGAVTENHVKGQQPEAQKPADRAVTMNQVQGQQPEENISPNEAVTMNQVRVEQPQEKKRPIEAVPNDHQLHQWGINNKRPRTGATHSLPRVFTSHYQHTFCPSGMPAPFGLPPNYYGATGGADYFCHPRPYPPFR